MRSKYFEKKVMLDILDSDVVIEDKITDRSRWTVTSELIFKFEDKIYRTYYDEGATEYQHEGPWETDDEVLCYEVEPYETTVTKYKEVI